MSNRLCATLKDNKSDQHPPGCHGNHKMTKNKPAEALLFRNEYILIVLDVARRMSLQLVIVTDEAGNRLGTVFGFWEPSNEQVEVVWKVLVLVNADRYACFL